MADDDACHDAHNAAEVFCRAFRGTIEFLCNNMKRELTFSTDLQDFAKRVCELVGLNFQMPVNYIVLDAERQQWAEGTT